uniref:Uncharacterized protein n=1 Tax=Setaria italica TaxID=4555 RepID=K3Y2U5_SETIT
MGREMTFDLKHTHSLRPVCGMRVRVLRTTGTKAGSTKPGGHEPCDGAGAGVGAGAKAWAQAASMRAMARNTSAGEAMDLEEAIASLVE